MRASRLAAVIWSAPVRPSRCRAVQVRGLRYAVREWGDLDAPPVLLLHGARDASATFQFLVDALPTERRYVAPDWRGHGGSDWTPGAYWLSDFATDLDALVDTLFGDRAVPVIGHSMGANVAALYAGLVPERVTRLVLLDALGNLLDQSPVAIGDTLRRMLASARPGVAVRRYPSTAAMADRLREANPRLSEAQAMYLAAEVLRPLPEGGFGWARDPGFRRSFPTLHDVREWGECWARIAAPVLSLFSSDPRPHAVAADVPELTARAAYFTDLALATVPGTGHNLHHDAPQAVARLVDAFLQGASA